MKDTEKKERRNAEVRIDIIPLLKALVSKIWLMVLAGAVCAAIVFGATKLIVKPTYRSSFTAYVNNQQMQTPKDYLTSGDVSAAKELVKTYGEILLSNTLLSKAAESIDLDYSYAALRKMVNYEIKNETEIISVHVLHRDPKIAYDVANAIAKTAPTYMADIVEGSSMRVIDFPEYPESSYKPNYLRYALIGAFIGVLLVALFVIIRYLTDDTVVEEEALEAKIGLPILGVIPDLNQLDTDGSGYYQGYSSNENSKMQERGEQSIEEQ